MFADKMPNCRLTEIMGIRAEESTALTAVLNANRQCMENTSELIIAVKDRNVQIDVIRTIIDRGVDVNMPDDKGCTALLYALEYGRDDIAKLLIDNGANQAYVDEKECASKPLIIPAAKNNMAKAVQAACIYAKPFIFSQYPNCVEHAESQFKCYLNGVQDGYPLYYAAKFRNLDILRYLIDQGAEYVSKVAYIVNPNKPWINGHAAILLVYESKAENGMLKKRGEIYSFVTDGEPRNPVGFRYNEGMGRTPFIISSSDDDRGVMRLHKLDDTALVKLLSPYSSIEDITYTNRAIFDINSIQGGTIEFEKFVTGFDILNKCKKYMDGCIYNILGRNCHHVAWSILEEARLSLSAPLYSSPNNAFGMIKTQITRRQIPCSIIEAGLSMQHSYNL